MQSKFKSVKSFFYILGAIKGFSSNYENITKWCLNCPKEILLIKKLLELSGISENMYYKVLSPKEVNKS